MTETIAEPAAPSAYRKSAGDEPLPGYRLVRPLGQGGFGEVWACEAPGGLQKAVKFVFADPDLMSDGDESLRQEYDAIERVKAIRHPFLLALERVEMVRSELVVVMELADRNLGDRFDECRAGGLPGIPEGELCGYFADVAGALDVLAHQHGLQHLDLKPANLFLVGVHAKLGDYGLVSRQSGGRNLDTTRGLTPKYVAPEVLDGRVDIRSDQYSLALVYQELLTGTFPYPAKSAHQMMMQHVIAAPDVSGLPPTAQAAVARALSKNPADRFPSCVAMVEQLMGAASGLSAAETWRDTTGTSLVTRWARMSRSGAIPQPEPRTAAPPPDIELELLAATPAPRWEDPPEVTLVPEPRSLVRLAHLAPIVPLSHLTGSRVELANLPQATELAEAVVRAAVRGDRVPTIGGMTRTPGGGWADWFPIRASGLPAPLEVLAEFHRKWRFEATQPDPLTVVFRRYQPQGLFGRLTGQQAGVEVVVNVPPSDAAVGEVAVVGQLFGTADTRFAQDALTLLPEMVKAVRLQFQGHAERRGTVRVHTSFRMAVFPVTPDGDVFPQVAAKNRDVSVTGVGFEAAASIPTGWVYSSFVGLGAASEWAILTEVVRTRLRGTTQIVGGRYRLTAERG